MSKEKIKMLDAIKDIGGKIILLDVRDEEHLNCWWYGGQAAAISVGEFTISVEAHGEIRLSGLLNGEEIEFADKSNGGTLFFEIGNTVDDTILKRAIAKGDLYVGNNNWFEMNLLRDGEFIDCYYLDNVLDDNLYIAVSEAIDLFQKVKNLV